MGRKRNEAVRRNGSRISRSVVRAKFDVCDKVYCEYCGKRIYDNVPVAYRTRAIGDHMIPISRDGPDEADNIAVVCRRCDSLKAALTKEEFLAIRQLARDVHEFARLRHKILFDVGVIIHDWKGFQSSKGHNGILRNIVRRAELEARRIPPDPECELCNGLGTLIKSKKVYHYCRCALLPK
jgi:Zn finger protein HypA/HybF involved in hydrogenase expression